MAVDTELAGFAANFHQDVVSQAESQDAADLGQATFTRIIIGHLVDAQELEGGEECHHKARGVEVSGYFVGDDGDSIDLFISHYTAEGVPATVARTEIEARLRRVLSFLTKALDGHHVNLEPASPAYDMSQRIHEVATTVTRVRVYLFTDGVAKGVYKPLKIKTLEVTCHIWDIVRLHRLLSSGRQREPIEIDFAADPGGPLPCLESPTHDPSCRVLVALIPAITLCKIYDKFGSRLLELNVRSFLQARGKVNKGIRTTLLGQPNRFLAYNNGISATAEEVKLIPMPGGGVAIGWVKNLQIVNGGQTTASIHHVVRKDKATLEGVYVQAKLTVVAPERVAEMVPLISRYANSQNKVNEADFSANDEFHVRVQELSRTVWAPPAVASQQPTRWFYERARGQYMDEKGRAGTPAKVRDFQAMNPPDQRLTKTDLAKYENAFDQLPHVVSTGGQKNFVQFTLTRAEAEKRVLPTQRDFELLIARAILFRRAEKIVGKLDFGGYRANIVAYTIAYLSHRTGGRIDLGRIWREQGITSAVAISIAEVSRLVHGKLTDPPPGRKNVTEWCKKEQCWDAVQSINYTVSPAMSAELVPGGTGRIRPASADRVSDSPPVAHPTSPDTTSMGLPSRRS